MKRYMDRFLSTDFNIFKRIFKRIKRKEDALSDIIADMLDPAGSHGQQRMFLDAFLRQIDRCNLLNRHVEPICEYSCGQGKIDILVDFGDFGIAIENKLWADDQDKQLERYPDALKEKYNNQFCLIYLTPDGREPSEKSIEPEARNTLIKDGHLLLVSYCDDMLNWLRECHQRCESDKFRWFLRDFMDYIPTMMEEKSMTGEKKVIMEHALDSKENLEMTLDIHFAGDDLCKRLKRDFLMKLRKCLDESLDKPQWKFVDDGLHEGRSLAFAKESWNKKYSIRIQEYQGRVEYGVAKGEKSEERIPGLVEILNDAMQEKGKWHSEWEWLCNWEDCYGKWDSKEALLKIKYDGEAVNQLCKKLILIKTKAKCHIDKYVSSNP